MIQPSFGPAMLADDGNDLPTKRFYECLVLTYMLNGLDKSSQQAKISPADCDALNIHGKEYVK